MFSRLLRYFPRRFSLRTALIVVTLLCVFLGVIARRWQRASDVYQLRMFGFQVQLSDETDPQTFSFARWVDSWTADGFAREVKLVTNVVGSGPLPKVDDWIVWQRILKKYKHEPQSHGVALRSGRDEEKCHQLFGNEFISWCFITGSITPELGEFISSLPNLKGILFIELSGESLGVSNVVRNAPIERLTFAYFPENKGYDGDFSEIAKSLSCRELRCRFMELNEEQIKNIGRIDNLESLHGQVRGFDSNAMKALAANLSHLKHLQLDVREVSVVQFNQLEGFRNLKTLELRAISTWCDVICTNEEVVSEFPHMPLLKRLSLAGTKLTPAIIPTLAERCPKLEEIEINGDDFQRNADGQWISADELAESPSE